LFAPSPDMEVAGEGAPRDRAARASPGRVSKRPGVEIRYATACACTSTPGAPWRPVAASRMRTSCGHARPGADARGVEAGCRMLFWSRQHLGLVGAPRWGGTRHPRRFPKGGSFSRTWLPRTSTPVAACVSAQPPGSPGAPEQRTALGRRQESFTPPPMRLYAPRRRPTRKPVKRPASEAGRGRLRVRQPDGSAAIRLGALRRTWRSCRSYCGEHTVFERVSGYFQRANLTRYGALS
jgi:hypothetical protein